MFYIFSTYFFIEIQRQILNSISYKIAHLFRFDSWHHRSKGFLNTIIRLDLVATKCLWAKIDQTFFLIHHFKITITSHWTLYLEERVFKSYHVIVLNAALLKILISKQNWKTRAENWKLHQPSEICVFFAESLRTRPVQQAKVQNWLSAVKF